MFFKPLDIAQYSYMQKQDLDQFRIIIEELFKSESEEAVVRPIPANQLFEKLDLTLQEEPISDESFYHSLKDLVLKTPRTATNRFFNQLFAGRKSKAVLGDLLSVVLNNSMYTYKVAGPMVGVEKEIIRKTAELIGYDEQSDGTIVSGGSLANFMAMVMGRDAINSHIKEDGISDKMVLYTSENCHYSIAKNASLMGVGRSQVRNIKTDSEGKMIPADLRSKIEQDLLEGFRPFFVNLTAGTTVLGSFDSIPELSEICKEFNLWLHVDGAYCGAVIFSDKYKHLVKGLEKADSFNVNAHKMLGTPLTCSVFLAKDKRHLKHSFSTDASYLYQTDGDDYNLGKTSLQCGRKNDALKLWTLWKSIGTKGLGQLVDHQFYLADVARKYIREHKEYSLYSFDNSVSICFNYKNIDPEKLCTLLYQKAELMVGFGTFEDKTFIRLVTVNADNSEKDVLNFFKTLENFVEENRAELLVNKNVSAN